MDRQEHEGRPLAAIQIDADALASWYGASDDCFEWVKCLVHLLPRGKGWVARKLGRSILKNTKGLMRLSNGVLMAVDPYNLDAYVGRSIVPGCVVTEVCQKTLDPGQCFFDLGANIGSVSLAVARAFDDQVHIHAFEPQPAVARQMAVSAMINGFRNVSVYQTLVGDEDGEAEFFVADVSTYASLLSSEHARKQVRCQMISIDHQIELGVLCAPDVIKIDVEGAELRVLRGMNRLIRIRTPVIVFEADEKADMFGGATRAELFEYLRSLADYEFFLLNPDPKDAKRVTRFGEVPPPASGNYLAVPAGRLEIEKRLPGLG